MNREDWSLWSNLTFKTLGYRKNIDFVTDNENIITLYEGMVTEIRMKERKPPRPVGEYGFSVWNIELGKNFNVDFDKLIEAHDTEDIYSEFIDMIKADELDIRKYKRIVFVNNFVLHEDYRKRGITEEFVEMLFRDYDCDDDDVAIFMLVKPFQDNEVDSDYYLNKKEVMVSETLNRNDVHSVKASEYYSLDEFIENEDTELNEYKLFGVAQRCGFHRINESHLFIFNSKKTLARMKEKQRYSQTIDNELLTFL